MMQHKAIAIPVIDTGQGTKFLLVHDKRHREWTFVTGGCKQNEIYNPIKCALRELEEETRGTMSLRSVQYNYFRFRARFNPIETSIYHVYVLHIGSCDQKKLEQLVELFHAEKEKMDANLVAFRKAHDENDGMQFATLHEVATLPNLWKFVLDNVIQNKDFYEALNADNSRKFTLSS